MKKEVLRKRYLDIRKDITNKDIKSKTICYNLMNEDFFNNSKVIALYSSLPNEVSTDILFLYSLMLEKIVLLPKVERENIKFYQVNGYDDIEKGSFGIDEPKDGLKEYTGDIDVMVIPGICFDKYGNRLGYGKGYYDRYLNKNDNCLKVGICFEGQFYNKEITTYKTDIKVDKIVTENNIIDKLSKNKTYTKK